MASTPPCDSAGTGEAGGSAAEDELTALVSIGVEWTTDDPTEAPPEAVVDGYTVVDADGMPRSLIDGSLESGVALYLSGTVRRCDRDADTGAATAAAAKAAEETARVWLAGPIHQWWMCGFSGDQEHMLVGVSTELCCYYMDKPSAEYYETALPLLQAAQLAKWVIKFALSTEDEDDDTAYEDMLIFVEQNYRPMPGAPPFSEELLLQYGLFILDQVVSLDVQEEEHSDSDEEDKEDRLMDCRALRLLAERCNFDIESSRSSWLSADMDGDDDNDEDEWDNEDDDEVEHKARGQNRRGPKVKRKHTNVLRAPRRFNRKTLQGLNEPFNRTKATTTPLIYEIFSSLFDKQLSLSKELVRDKRTTTEGKHQTGGGHTEQQPTGMCVYFRGTASTKPVMGIVVGIEGGMLHVRHVVDGSETILGECGTRPREVFLVDECGSYPKQDVIKHEPIVLRESENLDETTVLPETQGSSTLLLRMKWNQQLVAFTYIEEAELHALGKALSGNFEDGCLVCARRHEEEEKRAKTINNSARVLGDDNLYHFHMWTLRIDDKYVDIHVGDACMFEPTAWSGQVERQCYRQDEVREYIEAHKDESVYTEFYRKLGTGALAGTLISGMFNDEGERGQKPCCVGIICDLTSKTRDKATHAWVRVLVRPEDTPLSDTEAMHEPLNKLYWSNNVKQVRLTTVLQRCTVVRLGSDEERRQAEMDWADRPGVFFLDSERMCTCDGAVFLPLPATSPDLPPVTKLEPLDAPLSRAERLRCMELFSGCGGLSAGLHQSGVAEARWAVELEEGASHSFRLNNPGCEVFQDDCNTLLADVISGGRVNGRGQRYPEKGDVELIVGGPPCQGYSGLNRFSQGDYSKFRNSLVVSFLSFVDYYRPKYVVFENVQRFATFKKGAVLQLVVSSFLALGYQCTVNVLQAGAYGVPQTRRRTVIIAAAPGFVLPRQPAPLNAFYKSLCPLRVGSTTYSFLRGSHTLHELLAAPYRGLTVYDAVADLPPLAQLCNEDEDELLDGPHPDAAYTSAPLTTFQRTVRAAHAPRVTGHFTRSVRPLVLKRIELVPKLPYADWRDLPNIAATLCDGSRVDRLAYNYDDTRVGRAANGALRGVCPCAEGRPCDPAAVIPNTIIPWCLPHTSERHRQWKGLYGRLDMNSHFYTTVTSPEPMGKQGRVLHPNQDRIISVRECARSQGFPDTFLFAGTTLHQYKQIGNAVPPPMARAIGREILAALKETRQRIAGQALEEYVEGTTSHFHVEISAAPSLPKEQTSCDTEQKEPSSLPREG